MTRTIGRARLFFLALFFIGAVGVSYHQFFVLRPAKLCEAKGRWWHAETRECAIPIFLPDMTGRPLPEGTRLPRTAGPVATAPVAE